MSLQVYLASRSPRRRELLHQVGIRFELLLLREQGPRGPDVPEVPLPGEAPDAFALRVAREKAAFAAQYAALRRMRPLPLLAADTVVSLNGSILGKPADRHGAEEMLRALSGRTHRVYTAVALAAGGEVRTALSESSVTFRAIPDEEIHRYVTTGEPMDKAGAYGIQGRAALFVARLEGSYSGVMGLPLFETGELLRASGFSVP